MPNNLDPTWEAVPITAQMCGGHDAPLEIRVFDHDPDGTHDMIGVASTTLREIVSASPKYILINAGLRGQGGYQNSGFVFVSRFAPIPPTLDQVPGSYTISLKGQKLTDKDLVGKSGAPSALLHYSLN